MQQYYLRRLMDGLLDTERSNALASVQPHPAVQAFQAAVDTVASWHSSDHMSDTTTSESSDTSTAIAATSSLAAAAVAAAARPAEQAAQSISSLAAATSSQPQDSGYGQSESSQNAPPATAQAGQSAANLLHSLKRCKPGRKRKAVDMSNACRSDDAAEAHEAPLQSTQGTFDGHTLPPGPAAERLRAACHSAQHADSGQSHDIIAPNIDDRSAAGNSVQQHVQASRAAADCAGQQEEPLHMACMQILAGAVADCLNRPGSRDAPMGKPALYTCQQSCGTATQRGYCCIASQSCC